PAKVEPAAPAAKPPAAAAPKSSKPAAPAPVPAPADKPPAKYDKPPVPAARRWFNWGAPESKPAPKPAAKPAAKPAPAPVPAPAVPTPPDRIEAARHPDPMYRLIGRLRDDMLPSMR